MVLSLALNNWSCSLLSWRSQDHLILLSLQGAYSIKRIPVIIGRSMYLAETVRMHVASDSNGMLEIWRHGHGNKAILNLVKHCKTRVISTIFKRPPTNVTQHRRNVVVNGITIWDPPCSPPLHHFYLLYILFGVRAPHGGGILNLKSNQGFVG